MGVNAKLPNTYKSIIIRREEPMVINKWKYGFNTLLNYAEDHTLAPEGKTVTCCYYDADYDYWHALYQDQEKYRAEIKKLEQDAIATLLKRFPEAEGKIERTDVVTPMTYVRYCGAWRGSWMSWGSRKDVP